MWQDLLLSCWISCYPGSLTPLELGKSNAPVLKQILWPAQAINHVCLDPQWKNRTPALGSRCSLFFPTGDPSTIISSPSWTRKLSCPLTPASMPSGKLEKTLGSPTTRKTGLWMDCLVASPYHRRLAVSVSQPGPEYGMWPVTHPGQFQLE